VGPSVDHFAVVVDDIEEALNFYRDALGLPLIERRTVTQEGVEVASVSLGETSLELVRPLDGEIGVARFLKKRGEGLHHVCLTVDDIDGVLERLRREGAELINEEPQIGADGTRYAFIHPRSAHGVLVELYERSG
jgi:methylmalonyl-CoA/ethylmalonyl-CoA epimerase